jgi:hypothetical protein
VVLPLLWMHELERRDLDERAQRTSNPAGPRTPEEADIAAAAAAEARDAAQLAREQAAEAAAAMALAAPDEAERDVGPHEELATAQHREVARHARSEGHF